MTAALGGRPPSFEHSRALLEKYGMVQFAIDDVPDMAYGYCTDDNARALLAAIIALRLDSEDLDARSVGLAALSFLQKAQRQDGLFHNLMNADGCFTDDVGSQECIGRSIWACGVTARCASQAAWRDAAQTMLAASLGATGHLTALKARAYAILGLAAALAPEVASPVPPISAPLLPQLRASTHASLVTLCDALEGDFRTHATEMWPWWEDELNWGNARPPEAMLRAAAATGNDGYKEVGMRALKFLGSVTQQDEIFVPIGNDGWHRSGGNRAVYDQQPIEACGMVDAWLSAARLTAGNGYKHKALNAFAWFLGMNSENIMVASPERGACHDGLARGRLNSNMGAESTLSYVQAHLSIATAFGSNSYA